MDQRIDLDTAAAQLMARVDRWRRRGIAVGAPTWREVGAGWPPVITTDRGVVVAADSLGVALSKGSQEGSVVLFAGGWADLLYWSGDPSDDPIDEVPGWEDWLTIERYGDLLDRFGALFA